VQAPGYVAITHEMIHDTRVISLEGRAASRQEHPDVPRRFSRAMENGTLVVDTTNLTESHEHRLQTATACATARRCICRRFTRTDAGTIQYDVTITIRRPTRKAVRMAVPMTSQAGTRCQYACHEGNYGLPNILSAARTDELAAPKVKPRVSQG